MHVLLVEDDELIAIGIVTGLRAHGITVDHISNAGGAEALLKSVEFDLLILDLGLPDEDGLILLKRLRRRGFQLPVLLLTARDKVSDRIAGLHAGADDYVNKPFDLLELHARLHTLQRRVSGRCVNVIQHGSLTYDPVMRTVLLDGEPVVISRHEEKLLLALLERPGGILTANQLRDKIYGIDDDVESNVLNVHIFNLRRKLGSNIVETIRGLGYRVGKAGHEMERDT